MHISIENLPDDVTEDQLRELFDEFVRPARPEIELRYEDGHLTHATLTLPDLTPQNAAVLAGHFDQRWFGGKFLKVHVPQFE